MVHVADVIAGGAFVAVLALWIRKQGRKTVNLPPGPKPVPILGNVTDLTAKELWLPATQWARQYGEVVYLHVMGQGLVFVNGLATYDLLDSKGSIYSDKPPLVMAGELCGCENMVAFTRYGDQSRRQRKLMNKAFGINAIPAYYPLMERETNTLLRRLLANPADYLAATRRYAGGLTLHTVYGYDAARNDDPFIQLAEECVGILSNEIASGGGIWLVDVFPALKNLPDWAPGAGFKAKARVWKAKMEEFTDKPYEYFKSSFRSGEYVPSFCSSILEDNEKLTAEQEFDLKWSANSMYSASIDTVMAVFMHFLLAMMEGPEILKKAQAEIDTVCGDRLPTFSDRASLPYVEAVFQEVFRWACPVPLGLPHRLMEDDVYRGMVIPQGSLVFSNIWAMTRDETVFPDAHKFNPERFLEQVDADLAKKRNVADYVFGFGRRSCPGQHLVYSSLWILYARIMATMDICAPTNEQGEKVMPKVDYNNSVFRLPSTFQADIKPRSEAAIQVVRHTETL